MHNDMQEFLIFSGIISEQTVKVNGWIPNVEMKYTNERQPSGSQLNASTSNCHDLSIMYTPNTIRPKAVPMVDIVSKS